VDIPLPGGATIIGTPSVAGTGAGVDATSSSAAGIVSVVLPKIAVGNYQTPLPATTLPPVAPFTVTVDFTVALPTGPPPSAVPSSATFGLDYVTGVNLLGLAHQGGATSTQTCTITTAAPPPAPSTQPDATVLGATQSNSSGTLPVTGSGESLLVLVGLALVLIDLGYLFVTATRPAGRFSGFMRVGRR
jgi:LPXTG-motif cell wall-anchored protein